MKNTGCSVVRMEKLVLSLRCPLSLGVFVPKSDEKLRIVARGFTRNIYIYEDTS